MMEVDNNAEKEASEVLHSLLSVERRGMDSKENIIVSIPSMNTGNGQEYSNDQAQWHTPVLGQHSVFTLTDPQVIQSGEYGQQGQQVIWHGHTIQIENEDGITNETAILQDIYPIVTLHDNTDDRNDLCKEDLDTKERKPLIQRKIKKPKKRLSDDGEDLMDEKNKLEDNPIQVKAKLRKGCDCKVSCYKGLIAENVYKHRLNIAELTKSEHDMYLMGVTMACLANPLETSRHKARRRLRAQYVYQGRRVCLEAFLYLENVTHYQLKRIRHHVITHGVAPRIHGNMGKKPYNTFSLDIYKHATEFLKEYLCKHTTGGAKDLNKSIVVHGDSRKNLYDAYREYGEMLDPNLKLMGYSTFRHFMKEQFPNVRFGGKKVEEKKDAHFPFKSGKCMSYDKNKDPMRSIDIKDDDTKKEAKVKDLVQLHDSDSNKAQMNQHHQQEQQNVQQQQQQQIVIQQQSLQQVGHQMMAVQTVGDDSPSQQMEITSQVIPLVVQQPQQTYIVTPVSHLQTAVQGTWYRGH